MTCTNRLTRTALCATALVLLVAGDASAQATRSTDDAGTSRPAIATGTARIGTDMRLWSFGDCERNFPSLSSDARKECVRIVGSEEARDARAFHVCDATNEKDRVEAERCKAAYTANKSRAAQDGLVPNRPAQAHEALSPEALQRVRVIAETAVEVDRAAAASANGAATPAAPVETPNAQPVSPFPAATMLPTDAAPARGSFWSPSTLVTVVSSIALALLLAVRFRGRRLGGR